MRYTILLGFFALLLFAPVQAQAAHSVVIHKTYMHAGPGNSYPRVALVGVDTGVKLLGCITGFNWCEIETRGIHGWVNSGHIKVVVYSRRIGVANYASRSWLPVIRFSERAYWDRYYYDHDFYIKRYGHHDRDDRKRKCHYHGKTRHCVEVSRRGNDNHWDHDHDQDHDHDSYRDRDYYRDRDDSRDHDGRDDRERYND